MKFSILGVLAAGIACSPAVASDPAEIMRRIHDPHGGIIIAAHRGCHEAAPYHGWGTAPENSRSALMRCAELGVDIMEVDIHKSLDGYLVMIHDDRVDRTTDGKGAVNQLTLAHLKALHLRDDEGGPDAAVTAETIFTLEEFLALAKDRIVLNLDVKEAIYAEVVDAVVRAGAQDRVIVKTAAGAGSAALASIVPFDRVPFMVIPANGDGTGSDIPGTIARQVAGRVKPIAFELPYIPLAALPAITRSARRAGIRVWVNTLFSGFVVGAGSDVAALRDPDAVWGRLAKAGVSMFQTDEPEALVRYRAFASARTAPGSSE